ncbi:hypothetical protein P170DRAFT_513988 [Aspergillus steynii IBT 23096]|uniref:Rhodopsin domain-containing protein n=1 Tax=Aspergillus steynii IBT 23096 TaxID=1392250 RepID=A0A2I2FSP0_9EURO|nr:uncharacterized protein P170DRAFT_513988 [Aspergillus steynii IBT 23096]PLB43653.1 hypothetical protein P170DRAFT_513988 [Aspergillus steynii IBT 23096]
MASATKFSPGYLQESQQGTILGVTVLFIILETLAVTFRGVSKLIGRLNWGWDDALIVLGFILCTVINGCSIADVHHGGVGLHIQRVAKESPEKIPIQGKFMFAFPLIYFAAVVPPKMAIIYLYLSVFTQKPFRVICYVVTGIMIGNWIGTTVASFLSCQPLSYYWTQEGTCFDINSFFRWGGFSNIVTDVIMMVLPMPVVWELHASTRLKLGILITFLLGSLGLIASVIRFVKFYVTDAQKDLTWAGGDLVLWTVVECGGYLIAGCLPTYRPLARFVGRKLHLTSDGSSGGDTTAQHNTSGSSRRQTSKFQRMVNTTDDEEDAIGLVSVSQGNVLAGKHDATGGPGQIVVNHHIDVR